MFKKLFFILYVIIIGITSFSLNWSVIKNSNFTIFYEPDDEAHAVEVLKTLEYYRPYLENLTGNKISNLPVVIENIGVNYNGYADSLNKSVHIVSYKPNSDISVENWWRLIGTHEYTHVLQMSKTKGIAAMLNSIFGQIITPNTSTPGWLFEGITVYEESQHSPYEGRLNNGLFDEYLKVVVSENKFYNPVQANYNTSDYSIGNFYMYGSEFLKYLSMKYGEDKFSSFFDYNAENIFGPLGTIFPAVCLDNSAKNIYGKSFQELWDEWYLYLKSTIKLSDIKYEKITGLGKGTFAREITENKLYYVTQDVSNISDFNNFTINKIIERDLINNKERTIFETRSPLHAKIKVINNKLYFGTYNIRTAYNNTYMNGLGVSLRINELDLNSLNSKTITEGNYRTFGIKDSESLFLVEDQKSKFASDLFILNKNTGKKSKVISTDFILENIESYNDNLIAVGQKKHESFDIFSVDLKSGEFKPLISTPYVENEISISGDKLFYTANYEKVHNIYCYELTKNTSYKMTKGEFASTGFFNENEKKIYLTGLTSKGYDIFRTDAIFEEFKIPDYKIPQQPDLDKIEVKYEKGSYIDNLITLTPGMRIPFINYSNGELTIGAFLTGVSAIKDIGYSFMGNYNITKNIPDFNLTINSMIFAPLISTTVFNYKNYVFSASGNYNLTLLNNYGEGLNLVEPGLSVMTKNNFTRNSISPSLSIKFSGLTTTVNTKLEIPFERKELFSAVNRLGVDLSFNIQQIFAPFTLKFNTNYKFDPENYDSIFTSIRGSEKILNMKNGFVSSIDIDVPVISIRNGLWNPNIYIEDISLSIFGNAAIPVKSNLSYNDIDYSFGIAIKPEIGTYFIIKVPLTLGVTFNKEFIPQIYFNFGM